MSFLIYQNKGHSCVLHRICLFETADGIEWTVLYAMMDQPRHGDCQHHRWSPPWSYEPCNPYIASFTYKGFLNETFLVTSHVKTGDEIFGRRRKNRTIKTPSSLPKSTGCSWSCQRWHRGPSRPPLPCNRRISTRSMGSKAPTGRTRINETRFN